MMEDVTVTTVNDIKRIVSELGPDADTGSSTSDVTAVMNAVTNNGNITIPLKATTRSLSKRELLMSGFDMIKRWAEASDSMKCEPIEINGVKMMPAAIGNSIDGKTWLDSIITRLCGGYREGLRICWDIGDGYIYRYDIYNHKLTRSEK